MYFPVTQILLAYCGSYTIFINLGLLYFLN